MKRRHSIENKSLFSTLPLELSYKIQDFLNTVSLIYFTSTCKELYETRNYTENLKKEEIYQKCLHRIIKHLEDRNLLTWVKKFLIQFNSVISGNLVNEYPYSHCGIHPLLVCVPDYISFPDVMAYIKENTKTTDIDVFDHYNIVMINSNSLNILVTFLHKVESLEGYSEQTLPHMKIKFSLDFQNLYCDNLWQLFKIKEDFALKHFFA